MNIIITYYYFKLTLVILRGESCEGFIEVVEGFPQHELQVGDSGVEPVNDVFRHVLPSEVRCHRATVAVKYRHH